MCGNVWEWCADAWDETLFRRLLFAVAGTCRFRSKVRADERRANIGFRVAIGLSDGR